MYMPKSLLPSALLLLGYLQRSNWELHSWFPLNFCLYLFLYIILRTFGEHKDMDCTAHLYWTLSAKYWHIISTAAGRTWKVRSIQNDKFLGRCIPNTPEFVHTFKEKAFDYKECLVITEKKKKEELKFKCTANKFTYQTLYLADCGKFSFIPIKPSKSYKR